MLPTTALNNLTTNFIMIYNKLNAHVYRSSYLTSTTGITQPKNESLSKNSWNHAVMHNLKASRYSLAGKWDLANGKFRMNMASSCMAWQWGGTWNPVYDPASDSIPSASRRTPIGVRWIPTYSTLEAILFLMLRSLRLAWTRITTRETKQLSLTSNNGSIKTILTKGLE